MEAKLSEIDRRGLRKQSKDGRPLRPLSAYNIFCHKEKKAFMQNRKDLAKHQGSFMGHISAKWKNIDPTLKAELDALAKLDHERYGREEKEWKLNMWKTAQEQEVHNTASSPVNNEVSSIDNASNATLNTGTTAVQHQEGQATESAQVNVEVNRTPLINTPVCNLAVGYIRVPFVMTSFSGNAFPMFPFQRPFALGNHADSNWTGTLPQLSANNEAFSQVNSSNATLNIGETVQQQEVQATKRAPTNIEVKRTPLINTPVCNLAVGNNLQRSSLKARYSGNAFPTPPFKRSLELDSNADQLLANNQARSLHVGEAAGEEKTKTTQGDLAAEHYVHVASSLFPTLPFKKRAKLEHPTSPRHFVQHPVNNEPSSLDNVHQVTPFQTRPYLQEGMLRFPPRPAETEDPLPNLQASFTVGTGSNESAAVQNDTNYDNSENEKPQAKPGTEEEDEKYYDALENEIPEDEPNKDKEVQKY